MSGTTSLCLQQQWHNITHEPLVGGLLYSFQAGTLNPQNAFRTAALSAGSEYPNPLTLDASGRVPQMFYADGVVRLLLTDKSGVAQFDYDNVPVIGSSGGGGSVDTTDVTRLFGTGDMKISYGTGAMSGFVRGNKRTVGSATSGATELADATAQALFQWFWNRDAALPVLPSRGATAIADWTANKQIETPDFRGYIIGGLDGMGNTRANRLAAAGWDVLGTALGGIEAAPIPVSSMPSHNHDVEIPAGQGSHGHPGSTGPVVANGALPAGSFNLVGPAPGSGPLNIAQSALPLMTGVAKPIGGSQPFNITQPTRLVTVYFRL